MPVSAGGNGVFRLAMILLRPTRKPCCLCFSGVTFWAKFCAAGYDCDMDGSRNGALVIEFGGGGKLWL